MAAMRGAGVVRVVAGRGQAAQVEGVGLLGVEEVVTGVVAVEKVAE